MTTRRNALESDLLADLGIGTTPASDPATASPVPAASAQTPSHPATAPNAGNTKRIGVDVSEATWIAIKVVAAQQGTTVATIIRSHLADLIGDQGSRARGTVRGTGAGGPPAQQL